MTDKNKDKLVFLSDACGILFSIGSARKFYYDKLNLGNELGMNYDQFDKEFRQYEQYAQTKANYSISDAYNEFFKSKNRPDLHEKFKGVEKEKMKLDILPEVIKTLPKLKNKGVRYFLTTDSYKESEFLNERLKDMGLYGLIEGVYSSKSLGATKPSKKFFDPVLKDIGIKKENAVFIGHEPEEVVGANKYGLRTIALNYKPEDSYALNCATKINRFSDLIKLIDNLKKSKK